MSIDLEQFILDESAPRHDAARVQAHIENMWKRADVPAREHSVIRVVKLDIPYFHLWRADCLERVPNGFSFTYVIIVYEHVETHDLHLALSEKEEESSGD